MIHMLAIIRESGEARADSGRMPSDRSCGLQGGGPHRVRQGGGHRRGRAASAIVFAASVGSKRN